MVLPLHIAIKYTRALDPFFINPSTKISKKRAKYEISPQLSSPFCKVCSVLLDEEGLDEGGREVSFHSVYSDSVDGCHHVLA